VKVASWALNPLGMQPIDQGIGMFLTFIIDKGEIFGFDPMILLLIMLFAIFDSMAQTMEPYLLTVVHCYYQFRDWEPRG
jgi:hypothetical protein